MKMKFLGYCFIMFGMTFLSSEISAQAKYGKGYIIMLNNDTLKGEIKSNAKRTFDNFTKIAYRKSEGNEIKTFLPKKVKGYYVDSSTYVSKKIDDEVMFAKLLSSTTSTDKIYEVQTQYDSMNETKVATDYYIEKENKDFVKIKSKKSTKLIEEAKAKKKKIEVVDLDVKD